MDGLKFKYIPILLTLALLQEPGRLTAQDTSISRLQSQSFRTSYKYYTENALSLPSLDLTHYTHVEAGYRNISGAYRLSQEAEKIKEAYFKAEGMAAIGKFKTSGSFGYSYRMSDSVRNLLKADPSSYDPYYFFSLGGGNWEITNYSLKGAVTRSLWNDKMTAGLSAGYEVGNAWRKNDPRTKEFMYNLNGLASLQYNINKNHSIAAAGGLLIGYDEISNVYKNRDYSAGEKYLYQILMLSQGYGKINNLWGGREMNKREWGWKVQGMYNGRIDNHSFSAKGGYERTTAIYNTKPNTNEISNKFGSFYCDFVQASALYNYEGSQDRVTVSAAYNYVIGRDINEELQGNNYIYANDEGRLKFIYGKKKEGRLWLETGVNATVYDLYRIDGNTSHLAEYQVLSSGLFGTWYIPLQADRQMLSVGLDAAWRKPLYAGMSVPATQENIFTSAVALPDYYYYSATSFVWKPSLTYTIMLDRKQIYINLAPVYTKASVKTVTHPDIIAPGDSRFTFNISAGIRF